MINLRSAAALVALIVAIPASGYGQDCQKSNGVWTCRSQVGDSILEMRCEPGSGCTDTLTPIGKVDWAGWERARKRLVAEGYRDPGATNLCPAPHYRMTARDGCQPTRR